LLIECLKSLVVSHLVAQWIVSYLLYPSFVWFGLTWEASRVPTWFELGWQILAFMLVEDSLFYWLHRLLHHPLIYKHVHKKHHEFKVTVGIASEYAHPVEGIVSNVLPFIAGPFLVAYCYGLHVLAFWLWLFIRVCETVEAHSGYAFPFSPFSFLPFQGGPERHDYHHLYNVGSYGSFFNYWDWVMGTDKPFQEHQKKKKLAKSQKKE